MALAQHSGGGGVSSKPKINKATTTAAPSSGVNNPSTWAGMVETPTPSAAKPAATKPAVKPTFGQRVSNAINTIANAFKPNTTSVGKTSGVNNPSTWAGLVDTPTAPASKTTTTPVIKPASSSSSVRVAKPPKVGETITPSYTFLTIGDNAASGSEYNQQFNKNLTDYNTRIDNTFFSTGGQQDVDINDPVYLRTLKSDGEAFIAELERNPNKYDEEFIRNSIGAITRNNRRITERLNLLQLGDTQDPEVQKEAAEVIRKYTSPSFRGSDGKLSKYDEANLIWAVNMIGDKAFASNNEQFGQVNGADQHLWWEKQTGSGAGLNKEYSGLLEDAVKVLQRDYGYTEDDPLIQYYNAMIADSKILSDLYDKQAGELQGLSEDEQKKYIATYTAQQGVDRFNEDYWRSEIDRLREVADQQRAIALDESNSGKLDPTAAKEANAAANQAEALIDYYEQLISGVHDYEEMERLYNSSESTGESANVGSYLQKLNGVISDGKDELKTLQSELKTLKQEERSAAVQNDYDGMTQKQEEIKAKEAEIAQVQQTMADAQSEIDHQERIMGLREMQVDFAREGKQLTPASVAIMQDELAKYTAQVKAENRTLAGTARDYWDIAKAGAKMPVAGVLQFYTQGLKGLDVLTTKIANYITGEDTSQGVMAESLSDVIQRMEDRLVEIQSDSSEETAGGLEGRGFIGKLIGSSIQSGEGIAFDKAYGAALNAATGNALGKHAGLVSMAQRVFGQSVSEAKAQEKATGEKAEHLYLDAIIDAAIEVGSEMLGGDAFSGTYGEGLLDTARKGMSKAVTSGKIKNILLPMGEEALEEDVAFIAHRLVEFVMGKRDLSELAKMTEEDWEEFAISNLSAALLAGGDSAAMTIAKTSYGNALQAHRDEILQKALETPENTPARQLAEKYKDDISKISDYDLYRLDAETKSQELQNDIKSTKNAVLSRLAALGEPTEQTTDILGTKEDTSSLDKLADVIVLKTLGEDLSKANQKILDDSKYGQRVVNELDPENIKDGQTASDWVMDIESKVLHPEVYTHQREERTIANRVRSLGIKLSNKDISALTESYRSGKSKDFSAYLKGLKDAILAANAGYHLEDTVSQHESIKNLTPHQRNVIWKVATEATHSEYRFDKNEPMTINGVTGKLTKLTTRGGGMTAQLTDETTGEVHNVQLSKEDWNNMLKANPIIRTIYNEFNGLTGDIINAYNSDSDVPLSVYLENLRALKQAAKDSGMTWGTFTKSGAGQRIAANVPESLQRRVWNQAGATAEARQTRDNAKAANKSEAPSSNYIRSKGTVTSEAQKFTINGKEYNLPAYDLSKAERGSKDYRIGKLIKGISQVTGVNIVLYENTSEFGINGAYDKKTKTLYLDMNRIGNNGEVLLTKTISHELTHFIQDESPEDYAALKQFITNKLMNKKGGRTYEQILQEKMDREGIGTEEASDEIVADGCEMMLKNSKAFRELAEENLTLAEKLRNHLVGLFGKLNKFYKGVDTDYEEARYLAQYSDRIQKMWDRGIKNASINLDAERKNAALQEFENQPARAAVRNAVNAFAKNETRQMDRTEKAKGKSARFGKSPDEIGGQTTLDKNADAEKRKATEAAKKAAEREARNLREIPEQEDLFGEMDSAMQMSFTPYTSKEINNWKNSKNIIIYQSPNQLLDFIKDAKAGKLGAKKIYFGKVSAELAARVKATTGVEIEGYNCTLGAYEVSKIFAKHGNEAKESDRGQRALTENDLLEIPVIISEAEEIKLSGTRNGKPVIDFKKINGGKITVSAYVSDKHIDLRVQTMYASKKYKSLATPIGEQAPINTPEASSGTALNKIVSQTKIKSNTASETTVSKGLIVAPEAKPVNETKAATSEAVTIVAEDGKQYSIRSMRHDIADGRMFEDLKTYVGYSNKNINKLKQDLTALTNYMAQYADILDMNETYNQDNRPYKPYKPNSDKLYVLSLDFSTLCRKRLLTQHVMEELQTTLTDSKTGKLGRVLTAEEQLAIRDMLNEYAKQEKALKVACAMCYVEAARMKSPVQIEKALGDMRGLMVDYFAKRSPTFKKHIAELQAQWKADHGYDRDATKKSMKSKDQTAFNKYSHEQRALYQPTAEETKIIDAAVTMPRTTFLKASNLTELAENYPDIYTAYTNKLREATHSKGLETDIPYYYGDSKGVVSDSFIQAVNDENGMRFSSWSDFQMKHMLDMMTAVIELSTRKCAMHGYTKFLEQVRIFGKTGMMFNMSGVPSGNGFTTDGGLAFSPTESVLVYGQDNEYDAVAAREQFPETAGLQCIGISNAHIKALLDSDIIDYVIPYHTSGMNAGLRKMAGINNWSDFQGFQEAKIDDRIKPADSANYDEATWHKEPVFSEFFNAALDKANGYTKGEDGVTTMRRAADLYKQMCRDRGMKPKFSWGNSRVDADFSNEANYWKLLIDRKMINQKTGKLIQQKPVRPDFDFDAITREVKAEVDSYDAGLETKALDYIKEHLDELPNRVRDLKKSGTVKKLEAQTKPADMQRHLDNLFNSMMTSDTGTQETENRIQFSFVRPSDDLIQQAEALEAQGKDAVAIWGEIGLMKGPDGAWRTELDDSRIRFYKNGNAKSSGHGHMLDDYLEFPELYEKYPELKNIGITENPEAPNIRTSFDPVTGTININPNAHMTKDIKRLAVLHETQHMIQRLEGWAADEYGYGEQEAKLVEARHNLSKAQRRAMLPKLLSTIDKTYMPMAKSGQEKAAQQLVDDAAHAAGYTEKVYHGSVHFGDHTVLETSGIDSTSDGGTYEWSPYFATDKLEIAQTYSGKAEARQIGKVGHKGNKITVNELEARATTLSTDLFMTIYNRFPALPDLATEAIERYCNVISYQLDDLIEGYLDESTFRHHLGNIADNIFKTLRDNKEIVKEEGLDWFFTEPWLNAQKAVDSIIEDADNVRKPEGNYQYWVNTENFLVVEADFHKWYDLTYPGTGETGLKTRDIAKLARDDGYFGVKILNVYDIGPKSWSGPAGTVYIFFDPQTQVKSADPVTFDDDGEIIPLSERFNPDNPDIRFSLMRQFPNERSFLDAYNNRLDEEFEGYVLSPAQERMVIPKIENDAQADYYNNLPRYAEDIADGMIPFVPGDAIPDYDRSLIKYSSEWYKKNGLPVPVKRTPYTLFEPTLVDDGSVVERDELPFSISTPTSEQYYTESANYRNAQITQRNMESARNAQLGKYAPSTVAQPENPVPTPADVGTPADVATPAPARARTGARVGETRATGRQKQSKFASNTLEGMNIWDEIGGRENTMDRNGEFLYNEVTERESMDAARQRLEADWGYWERDLMGEYTSPTADREWTGKDLDTAMAIFRQKRIDANRNQDQSLTPEERYADVDAWLQRIREKATAGGQLIQAFAKYSRTPEGVLIQAGRDLAANNKLTRDQRNEILNKMINFAMTLDALREAGDTGDNSSLIELIKQQAEMRGTPVSQRIENGLKKEQFQYLYDVALTQLAQIAADYRPNSVGKKLSTYQTIAHLLNLRTGTRNVVANMAFRTVDRIANMIAAPMDALVGKITGNRTVGWKQLGRLSSEVRESEHERGRRASIEASLDVDPYNGKDKYGTSRRTWKMKDGPGARVMSTLEKWMAYELNVTDEISKGIILGEVMESLSPFIENNLLSEDEAVAMAKQEMLYRTFQDDNWANGLLGAIKNALNVIGTGSTNGKMIGSLPVHDFGLGDIVTKYVQVPGSLIMRMIEYSPIGTIKAVADMANIFTAYNQLSRSNTLEDAKQAVADLRQQLAEAKAAGADTTELKAQLKEATSNYKDVKSRTGDIRAKAFLKDQGQYTKTKVAINNEQARMNALQAQRRAMLQLGRSLTGSGLIALFAALAKAGLLRRDDDDEDKDIRALNTSAGLSGTQLNLSALMRAASGETNWSEWLDGDKLMDIGFLEPLNGLMTIGAIVAKNNDNLISRDTMNDTLAGLMENIAELPVMQTLGTIQSSIQNLQYDAESENATQSIAKDVMSVAIDVARSSASGFIPAPVRQAAQATDEYARDMYQGDTGAEKFVDSLKSSIPGLRQTLPQKLDNFGNPRTTEADPFMRAMNAFVNPGNLRTYRSADLTNELNRLYDATGKNGILPKRYAPYSINEGPGYQLTADEKRVYQITRGQTADNLLRDLFSSQAYQTATDEQRAEWAKDVVSYADYVAKQEFLNNRNYLDEKGEGYSSRAKEEMKEALAKGVPLDTYLKYVDAIDRRYTVATYDYEARNETLEAEYRAGNINDEQFIQLYDYTTNSSDTTPEKLTAASEAGIAPPDYLIYKAEINDNPDFNRTKANYGKNYDTANKKAISAYIWSVAKTDEQAKILWLLRYKESTLNKLYQYKPKS